MGRSYIGDISEYELSSSSSLPAHQNLGETLKVTCISERGDRHQKGVSEHQKGERGEVKGVCEDPWPINNVIHNWAGTLALNRRPIMFVAVPNSRYNSPAQWGFLNFILLVKGHTFDNKYGASLKDFFWWWLEAFETGDLDPCHADCVLRRGSG